MTDDENTTIAAFVSALTDKLAEAKYAQGQMDSMVHQLTQELEKLRAGRVGATVTTRLAQVVADDVDHALSCLISSNVDEAKETLKRALVLLRGEL